jgi:rhamnosyltransferase
MPKSAVVIPTLNGGHRLDGLLRSLSIQTYQPDQKVIVDSGSRDQTVAAAKSYGFDIVTIDHKDFNHGATRQMLVEMVAESDLVIFFTQDAILANHNSLEKLVACLDDPKIGAAYGRQLPNHDANRLEAYARLFNYPGIGRNQ